MLWEGGTPQCHRAEAPVLDALAFRECLVYGVKMKGKNDNSIKIKI